MIFSSGSRIGSLLRATQSRRGTGFPGAAFVCCTACCAYARCTHVAATLPRRAEKSRRFTGHLHSRIAHSLEADRELLQFTSGGVGRGRRIPQGRKRRDAATLMVHKTVVCEQSPLARDPQELRRIPAQNRTLVRVAQPRRAEHVIYGRGRPGKRKIGADHNMACAAYRHQVP